MTLEEEADRLIELLRGKTVAKAWRHRDWEVVLEFTDGTRFFVDSVTKQPIDLSVTTTEPDEETAE